MAVKITLDHDGIGKMLKSPLVMAAIHERAEIVRAHVSVHQSIRRHKMLVTVRHYVTDRAAAAVTIEHPGGLGVQAKYGVLSRAAGAAHLEFTEVTEALRKKLVRRRKARTHRDRMKTDAEYARAVRARRLLAQDKREERERRLHRRDEDV